MKDRSPKPKLTKNEEKVLQKIIEHAKTPDLEIATQMGLSQQAVFKIRHKLEEIGIIKGYSPIIDFKKVGINLLVVLGIKFTTYAWERYSEQQLNERIEKIPEVIISYRLSESKITHLLIMGFQDIESKDRYLMKLHSRYSKEIEIVHVFPFGVDRIIKSNTIGLLQSILNPKKHLSSDFFG